MYDEVIHMKHIALDTETKEYISELTDKIREKYNIKTPIQDMTEIVKQIGGYVIQKYNFDSYYDATVMKTNDKFYIAIPIISDIQRKNFVIVHELGHLFLHMGFKTNIKVWDNQVLNQYRRFSMLEQEIQANEFAVSFLMPKDEYINEIELQTKNNKNIDINIKAISEKFNVSHVLAYNRGYDMIIIK